MVYDPHNKLRTDYYDIRDEKPRGKGDRSAPACVVLIAFLASAVAAAALVFNGWLLFLPLVPILLFAVLYFWRPITRLPAAAARLGRKR
ncbi:MAG: hypothetical protein ACOC5K_03370 [Chloroflexota bacterium]